MAKIWKRGGVKASVRVDLKKRLVYVKLTIDPLALAAVKPGSAQVGFMRLLEKIGPEFSAATAQVKAAAAGSVTVADALSRVDDALSKAKP